MTSPPPLAGPWGRALWAWLSAGLPSCTEFGVLWEVEGPRNCPQTHSGPLISRPLTQTHSDPLFPRPLAAGGWVLSAPRRAEPSWAAAGMCVHGRGWGVSMNLSALWEGTGHLRGDGEQDAGAAQGLGTRRHGCPAQPRTTRDPACMENNVCSKP